MKKYILSFCQLSKFEWTGKKVYNNLYQKDMLYIILYFNWFLF